jgi:beta-galactosidase
MSVTVAENGLLVDGRLVPLLSGDVHYWRLNAKDWPAILQRVMELGFRMICTYIPWSVHEITPGNFDFGELDPAKNLGAFLDLARELGLAVLVRPGPHINAELTYFGYPRRLFEDPTFLARDSRGGPVILPIPPRMFPAISYASNAFWRELEVWFDALAPVLRPRLYPHGSIFAIQTDNEMSLFFRTSPYDQDYHPDARAKWTEFLKAKYGGAVEAAEFYRFDGSLTELPMPEDFRAELPRDLPYYLDWIEFKEDLIAGSLARLRTMWEDRGVKDVAFFHNFPGAAVTSPLSITRVEKNVAFCGLDFYSHKTEYPVLKRRLLTLTGQSRFPTCPEFASGCWHVWPPVDLDDQRFTTMVAWMHGVKGINFYMIVERERWFGSPITRQGGRRPEPWDFFREHLALLDKVKPWRLRRKADVCLLSVRDYERLENATSAVSPIMPMALEGSFNLEDFCYEQSCGFARPIQYLHAKMLRGWEYSLSRIGIPYVIGSSDLDVETLNRYQAVVCPTFEFLDADVQRRLAAYVETGGNLICGPEVPAYDARFAEFSTLDHYTARPTHRLDCDIDTMICNAGSGRIVLVTQAPLPIEETEPIARAIVRHLHIEAAYPCLPPCETSLHLGPNGERFLFVVNPTDKPLRPTIRVTPGEKLVDLSTSERYLGDAYIAVDLPPYFVRVLEVLPC